MSALSPHIRVLRAESEALLDQARSLRVDGQFVAAFVVLSIGHAKMAAVEVLVSQEIEREARLTGPQVKGH